MLTDIRLISSLVEYPSILGVRARGMWGGWGVWEVWGDGEMGRFLLRVIILTSYQLKAASRLLFRENPQNADTRNADS
uniref:Uncharacterized protein n=1 Tax=Moorena producens (strain JHB) TaxID=1454205 RepID=A0A1D9FTU2_MOOP1